MKQAAMLATLWLAANAVVHGAEVEVGQKDMKFSRWRIVVKVGDTVSFKNDDTVSHNIFSLSEAKTFDLGSYQPGQSRKVTFNKPGMVEVECAVHPSMHMTVEVQK
ncbi:methylamine utilization protein [Massilia endophytica]|uniref:methylamine utilization protein n=1 Tax=Massilia endophytica TaxID=2899220 RepID=UPI001E3BA9D6|nr:methylamine utilization protein [Massilia endophytica]UGQ47991.1 methylamine utilization protein [Massilia endophytica]